MTTMHWSDSRLEVHKVVVGSYDNNVFVLRCRETGESVLIDAANEHEKLLELCTRLNVKRVLETHGHWDHIGAVPAIREAGYEVGGHRADAPMLKDGRLRRVPRRRRGHRGRPAPPARDPQPRPHARLDLVPDRGHPGAVHRRHAVPGRRRQHQVRSSATSPRSSTRSTTSCSRCRPTRS